MAQAAVKQPIINGRVRHADNNESREATEASTAAAGAGGGHLGHRKSRALSWSQSSSMGSGLLPNVQRVKRVPASKEARRAAAAEIRRDTLHALPSHVRASICVDGHRRNTVVMPLMEFLSRHGRPNVSSLSFREGSFAQGGAGGAALGGMTRVENTYQLAPARRFPTEQAREIMREALQSRLVGKTYNANGVPHEAKVVADLVKDRVKAVAPPRFRVISWVTIGQKEGGGVRMASRGLWDETCDTYAEVVYENGSLYAVAVLYAIYQE